MVTAAATALAGALSISVGTATLIVQAGLYVGVTAASILLNQADVPKPETGTKLKPAAGGAVAQSIIFGEKETAGSLIYQNSWGRTDRTPNGMLVSVYCLSDMPCTSLQQRIWINGKKCTIDFAGGETFEDAPGGGTVSKGYRVNGLNDGSSSSVWVKFLDGTQTAADPYLRAMFKDHAKRPWKITMIGRGRALAIVTAKYNSKEPEQWPQPIFVVRGAKLYDPRKDSTNGGSGTHRWGNSATYEYTANPIVIAYNIMRGIYWETQWMYGGQNAPARRFDADTWFAAMNKCDLSVALAGGGTEPRYRMGAEIELSDNPIDNLDRIFATCSARFVETGGIFKIYAGDLGAPVFSFADGQVVVTEKLERGLFPTQGDICNTISGTYYEPNAAGGQKAYRKRSNSAYIAQDRGQVRARSMNFDFVRSGTQAQRLAKHALNDNRHFLTVNTGFTSLARKLEPGDVVNWSTSKRFGYVTKQFVVEEVTLREDGIVLVLIRETDPTDGNWQVSDELPDTVGLYEESVPPTQTKAVTITNVSIKNGAGVPKRPAFKIAWDVSDDDVDAKRMDYRVRLLDGEDWIANSTVSFEEGQVIVSEGILRNETYQVQARLVPESGRPTQWTEWVTITALNVGDDGVSENAPPALASAPTMALKTRVNRSGEIIQRLVISQDVTGRAATESYRIRVIDTTEDPDEVVNYKTDEFPYAFRVQTNHTYVVRVLPVSRFGVVGPLSNPATGVAMPIGKKPAGNVPAGGALTVTPGHKRNTLEWPKVDRSVYPDHAYTEVERDTVAGFTTPGDRVVARVTGNTWADTKLKNKENKHYRIRHFDTSDNPGAYSNIANGETVQIGDVVDDPTTQTVGDYKDNSIAATKLLRDDLMQTTTRKLKLNKTYKNKVRNAKEEIIKGKGAWEVKNPTKGEIYISVATKVTATGVSDQGQKQSFGQIDLTLKTASGQQWKIGTVKSGSGGTSTQEPGLTTNFVGKKKEKFSLIATMSADVPVDNSPAGIDPKVVFVVTGTIKIDTWRAS